MSSTEGEELIYRENYTHTYTHTHTYKNTHTHTHDQNAHTQPPKTAHAACRLNTDCLALISPTRALHLITISVINNRECGRMDWVLWQEKAPLYHL